MRDNSRLYDRELEIAASTTAMTTRGARPTHYLNHTTYCYFMHISGKIYRAMRHIAPYRAEAQCFILHRPPCLALGGRLP